MCAKILLAYDGTVPAEKAFDFILQLPLDQRTELAILAVIKPSSFAVDYGAQTVLENAAGELSSRMTLLQWRAKFGGTPSTAMVRIGHPVEQIVRAALEWQADMIVIGHRARLALIPSLWGSVSSRVRARATCAVHVLS
jgi:nucleotide-binding universal stress UspA family protein